MGPKSRLDNTCSHHWKISFVELQINVERTQGKIWRDAGLKGPPLGYQLVRPLRTGNEREAQNTESVTRRQVSGTLVQQSVLHTGGFSLIPICKLHFIFHMVPIRTPFKGSKKITSPKTFWWLSLSLRVEPKASVQLPGPHDLAPATSVTVAPNTCPSRATFEPHRPLRSALSTLSTGMLKVSVLVALSRMFPPKHLHNLFHLPQVSTHLQLYQRPSLATFFKLAVSYHPLLSLSVSLPALLYSPWNGAFICLSPVLSTALKAQLISGRVFSSLLNPQHFEQDLAHSRCSRLFDEWLNEYEIGSCKTPAAGSFSLSLMLIFFWVCQWSERKPALYMLLARI